MLVSLACPDYDAEKSCLIMEQAQWNLAYTTSQKNDKVEILWVSVQFTSLQGLFISDLIISISGHLRRIIVR